MPRELFSPNLSSAYLKGEEFHHAIYVVRLRRGDELRIIDGLGHAFVARLKTINRKQKVAELEIVAESESFDPEVEVTVLTAIPRPARMDFLVEKATELGVYKIVPVMFDRSERVLLKKVERWRKIAISASKQCGRALIPRIHEPLWLQDGVKLVGTDCLKLVAVPPAKDKLSNFEPKDCAAIVVGPEGGFTDEEIEFLKNNGFVPFSLGRTILRVETAVVASLAIWLDRIW